MIKMTPICLLMTVVVKIRHNAWNESSEDEEEPKPLDVIFD